VVEVGFASAVAIEVKVKVDAKVEVRQGRYEEVED
jgi:hypothetical protein